MALRAATFKDDSAATISNDRRRRSRFPIDLPVQFKIVKAGCCILSGEGRTIDLSSGGIAFAGAGAIEPGTEIELAVTWPVLLGGSCAIKLVAFGRVVWNDSRATAVEIARHEFRTLGSRTFQGVAVRAAHGE